MAVQLQYSGVLSMGDINVALELSRTTPRTLQTNNNSAYLGSTPYSNRVLPKISHWYGYMKNSTPPYCPTFADFSPNLGNGNISMSLIYPNNWGSSAIYYTGPYTTDVTLLWYAVGQSSYPGIIGSSPYSNAYSTTLHLVPGNAITLTAGGINSAETSMSVSAKTFTCALPSQYMSYNITNAGFSSHISAVDNNTWVLDKTIYGNLVDFTTYTNYYTAGPVIGSVVYNDSTLTSVFVGNNLHYQYSIIYNSQRYLCIVQISATGVVMGISDMAVDTPRSISLTTLSANTFRIGWNIPASKLSMLTNTTKSGSALAGYKIYNFITGTGSVYVTTLPTSSFYYDVTVSNVGISGTTPATVSVMAYYADGSEDFAYGSSTVFFGDQSGIFWSGSNGLLWF